MTYYTIPPSANLAKFVRCFWVLESNHPSYIHRSMADVCVEMVFHYNGQFEELSFGKPELASLTCMQGPSNQIRRFKIDRAFGIFGVYLYPYSLPVLFNIPATELSNQMPDLFTIMGRDGTALEEKMMLADNNEKRIEIITGFLEQRLEKYQRELAVCSSIQFIIQSKGLVNIQEVADQCFVSQRQFERKFKEYSGLTPKLFSRIARFHAACQYFGNADKSLTDIAYECGYYDQSHFIHDFKEFSGLNPKHYFSGNSEGTEWRG
jgi:AraC-like DNA-binding protein